MVCVLVADNTSLTPPSHIHSLPRPLYRLKSPLSYYVVLYVQISRKLRPYSFDSLLLRLARSRAAGPPFAFPVTFSPSKDSRRGSNTGDYGAQLSYDELEFSVTRDARDIYVQRTRARPQPEFIERWSCIKFCIVRGPRNRREIKQPAGRKADCEPIDFSGEERKRERAYLRKFRLSVVRREDNNPRFLFATYAAQIPGIYCFKRCNNRTFFYIIAS